MRKFNGDTGVTCFIAGSSPVLSRNCKFYPYLDQTSQVARPIDFSSNLAERFWDRLKTD